MFLFFVGARGVPGNEASVSFISSTFYLIVTGLTAPALVFGENSSNENTEHRTY